MLKKLLISRLSPWRLKISRQDPWRLSITPTDQFYIKLTRIDDVIPQTLPLLTPPIIIENAAPSKIKIPYDKDLDETSVPEGSAYVLLSGRTVDLVEVIGPNVFLTPSSRYYWGDVETVAYNAPATNMIKSTLGGEAASFTATTIMNLIELDARTITLVAQYSAQPTDALKAIINYALATYRDAGILDLMDAIYFRILHDSQAATLNFVKDQYSCTIYGGAGFTPKLGISGNAIDQYIDTGILKSASTKLGNNNMSFGVAFTVLPQTTGRHLLGFRRNGYNRVESLFSLSTPEAMYANSNTTVFANMTANDLIAVSRSADAFNTPYLNGVPGAPVSAPIDYAGNWPAGETLLELCYRFVGNPTNFTDGTIGHSFYGSRLNDTQQAVMNTVWQYFKTNIGGAF